MIYIRISPPHDGEGMPGNNRAAPGRRLDQGAKYCRKAKEKAPRCRGGPCGQKVVVVRLSGVLAVLVCVPKRVEASATNDDGCDHIEKYVVHYFALHSRYPVYAISRPHIKA